MNPRFLFVGIAVALSVLLAVMPAAAATPDLKNMTEAELAAYSDSLPHVTLLIRNIDNYFPATTPCYGTCEPLNPILTTGKKIEFYGENTVSKATYLSIIGPGLDEDGAQIIKTDPAHSPVESGNPATFGQASVGSDHTWSWTWDTTGVVLKDGTYRVVAASHPNGLDAGQAVTARGYLHMVFKNPAGTATTSTTTVTPTSTVTATQEPAETVMPGEVTIMGSGDLNYFAGDDITFSGKNTAGWKTYLFITGPGLAANGSQIHAADPKQSAVENGNPVTFKQMDVQGDHTWSWKWGTANMNLETGTYTVYAVAGPADAEHLEKTPYGTITITIRNPAGSKAPSTVTTIVTPAATMTTPTRSPGFGLPAVLAGLGAVAAVLLVRRNRH